MIDLNMLLDEAVESGAAPFLVGMTADSQGVSWSAAAGERSPGVVASEDTVFRIVSMSKAVGSTAVAILLERGQLHLDSPVDEILPQFAGTKILEGFDGDIPRFGKSRNRMTVRHLATHTSGLVYEFWDAEVSRYLSVTGQPSVVSGLKAALPYPLRFEPGERWQYGPGIDWLGLVVEAVDGRRIDQFCRDEIFDPLDLRDTRFELENDMAERLADVHARSADGTFVAAEMDPPSHPEFYGMGHALYSTAPDYMRFLRMFLNRGQLEGTYILSESTVTTMLANHIGGLRLGRLKTTVPQATADLEFFPGFAKSHSFGFARMESDVPGMRSAGSQFWGGVLNTHFWFDSDRNVAAILMTQLLPFLDPKFMKVFTRFERGVYARN